jgi:hypothetical protein
VTFIPHENILDSKVININLKESVSIYKDLKEFEESDFKDSEKAYGP